MVCVFRWRHISVQSRHSPASAASHGHRAAQPAWTSKVIPMATTTTRNISGFFCLSADSLIHSLACTLAVCRPSLGAGGRQAGRPPVWDVVGTQAGSVTANKSLPGAACAPGVTVKKPGCQLTGGRGCKTGPGPGEGGRLQPAESSSKDGGSR